MKPIIIELTPEQRAELEPLFDMVRMSRDAGEDCMILAQVFVDAMRVGFLPQKYATAVHAAMGSTQKTYSMFAEDRIEFEDAE